MRVCINTHIKIINLYVHHTSGNLSFYRLPLILEGKAACTGALT